MQDTDGKRGGFYEENDDFRFALIVIAFTIALAVVSGGVVYFVKLIF